MKKGGERKGGKEVREVFDKSVFLNLTASFTVLLLSQKEIDGRGTH